MLFRVPPSFLRFIFQSGRQLSSFFPFKDRIPCYRDRVSFINTRVNAVGHCILAKLSAIYIRVSQSNMGVSPLTGKRLATTSLSSIQAHIRNTNRTILPNDFLIISSCQSSSNFELLIRESLFTSKFRPSLNENNLFIRNDLVIVTSIKKKRLKDIQTPSPGSPSKQS